MRTSWATRAWSAWPSRASRSAGDLGCTPFEGGSALLPFDLGILLAAGRGVPTSAP